MENKEPATIGMLLDIENLYGEHQGRLAPFLTSALLIAAPPMFYVYSSAFLFFPIWLFILVMLPYSIFILMLIPGRMMYRVAQFRKTLENQYQSTANLMNIKTIHPDGCVEYLNGKICYMVVCYNGTVDDQMYHSIDLRKLIDSMIGDYECDTYIHNVTEAPELRNYYDKVANFDKNISARNFINIIDHNIELTEDTSLVQATIYCIKGSRSDWKDIKTHIDMMLNSNVARAYKTIYRVRNEATINAIINRDIDSVINVNELLRRKYANHVYDTSKVLAYDLPDDKVIIQGQGAAVRIVDDEAPVGAFHQKYGENDRT